MSERFAKNPTALNTWNCTFCGSLQQLCQQAQLLTPPAARCPQSNLSLSYGSPVKPSCWDTAANPKLSWDLCTRTPAILWTSSVCLPEPVWMWPKPQLPRGDPSAPSLTPPRQSSSIPPFAPTKKSQKALPAWFLTPNHSQTSQNWGSALLQLHGNIAILLSRIPFCTPRLVIHIFLGLGRGSTWEDAQLFHNFCLPFFQQVNKSKDLIIFAPLQLPESIKITHKNHLGNSTPTLE